MPLEKKFEKVVTRKEESKREITRLTELDKNDKNTIYNRIFTEVRTETQES